MLLPPLICLALAQVPLVTREPTEGPFTDFHSTLNDPALVAVADDVLVARIKEVSSHPATNGNPPRVKLEVIEVLHGDAKANRSEGIWCPRDPLDDQIDGKEGTRLAAWMSRPLAGPQAGSQWVLWGKCKKGKFWIWSYLSSPCSEKARAWALARLREGEEYVRRQDLERDAAKKARVKAQVEWRSRASAQEIERYCTEADFVAIGKYSGGAIGMGQLRFQITDVLKGVERNWRDMSGDTVRFGLPHSHVVWLKVSKEVRGLLDHGASYLLFLTEKGLVVEGRETFYERIGRGDGVIFADDAAMVASREALRRNPGERALPALLGSFGDDERFVTIFQRAAEGRFAVLRQSVYMGFIPAADSGLIAPGGHTLVVYRYDRWPRPKKLQFAAFRLGQGKKQLVFRGECDPKSDKELSQTAEEIVRRLLDPKIGVGVEPAQH